MPKKWIQEAANHHDKGSLHRQLEISQDKRIPKTLLLKIRSSETGQRFHNPTATGKRTVEATILLKRRANFALNVGYGRYRRR